MPMNNAHDIGNSTATWGITALRDRVITVMIEDAT